MQTYPASLAADPTGVYFADLGALTGAEGAILRVHVGVNGAETVVPGLNIPYGPAIGAAGIYWTAVDKDFSTTDLMTSQLDGSRVVTLAAGVAGKPGTAAVDATDVYWMTERGIYSCPLAGCAGQMVTVATAQGGIVGFALQQGYVYWLDLGSGFRASVFSCPSSGCSGAPTTLATGQLVGTSAPYPDLSVGAPIVADASNIYWTTGTGVMMCARGGCGGQPTVLPGTEGAYAVPGGLAVDSATLYWVTQSSIDSCPTPSCAGAPPNVVPVPSQPSALAVNAMAIFWVDEPLGTVMAVAK